MNHTSLSNSLPVYGEFIQNYGTNLPIKNSEFTQGDHQFTVVPKSPAYVLGEQIVRPLIDIICKVCSYMIDIFRAGFFSIDTALSKVFKFIPGVNSEKINEKFQESILSPFSTQVEEQQNVDYHNNGPFEPLEIVKEGGLLTSPIYHKLRVVSFEKSSYWDGALMTYEKVEDYFEHRVRFIDIQPNGEVNLSLERTSFSVRSLGQSLPISAGIEIDSNRYIEVFRNMTPSASWINIVDSKNTVIKSCPSRPSSIMNFNIYKLDENTLIKNVNRDLLYLIKLILTHKS
jgi:hypothetical protein